MWMQGPLNWRLYINASLKKGITTQFGSFLDV